MDNQSLEFGNSRRGRAKRGGLRKELIQGQKACIWTKPVGTLGEGFLGWPSGEQGTRGERGVMKRLKLGVPKRLQ